MTKKIVHESWRDVEQKDFSKRLERVLVCPDTHSPFFNKKSWGLMLKVGFDLRPNRIIHLGDMSDFYAISFYKKHPLRLKKYRLIDEIRITNERYDDLDMLGATHKQQLEGNHEDRWNRYLIENSPELMDLPGMTVPELYRLEERGWGYTPYRKEFKVGKMFFNHDLGKAGKTAHIAGRVSYEHNSVIGHTHHMGIDYLGNHQGDVHVGAALGWLGDVSAVDYNHIVEARKWVQGFGVAYVQDNGVVHLQPIPIIKNSCVVSGKLYKI